MNSNNKQEQVLKEFEDWLETQEIDIDQMEKMLLRSFLSKAISTTRREVLEQMEETEKIIQIDTGFGLNTLEMVALTNKGRVILKYYDEPKIRMARKPTDITSDLLSSLQSLLKDK